MVAFVQGCAFLSLMDALTVFNAAATLTARSSAKSSESEKNSVSLTTPTASSDAVEKPVAYIDGISGTYLSEITSNSKWQFTKKYKSLKITFTQYGNRLFVSEDKFNTKIEAKFLDNAIVFYVLPGQATGFYDAEGEWRISSDGTRLEGSWIVRGSPDAAAGKWNLIKIK